MNDEFIRQTLIDRSRHRGESIELAARAIVEGFGVDPAAVENIVKQLRREGRRLMLLDSPPGVHAKEAEGEARLAGWYVGPEEGDYFWPMLKAKLEDGSLKDVLPDIDTASTKVVANLADPTIRRLTKKGLVVGYVQSGKTANYTAVMAKAADAGYRMFIVLSGMHNNLRRQTQMRLTKDLINNEWAALTTDASDFGTVLNGAALMSRGVHMIAVVKKNESRLRRLRDWLRDIPEETRARCPVLLLDDEADQATPNTKAARDEVSRINALVREIWAEIPGGTYVGYTATPFANVFMDPSDDTELYPSDFIIDLPRPTEYFGAERVFGSATAHDEGEETGLDMVREISDDDAGALVPPSKRDQRASFAPNPPSSMVDACIWFIVASAVRRARGQTGEHSSMLIHTTQYVDPHFAMQREVLRLKEQLKEQISLGDLTSFKASFEQESSRASEVATLPMPAWEKVSPLIAGVLDDVAVIVDNGTSRDRLDYNRVDESGNELPETVIAIGGGTLSRGLTLEGLIVSYFTRTSNTYDTLLQMGRWFGYRPRYEDLPRIWVTTDLRAEFQFLALVEQEIRDDMRRLEQMGASPKQFGVRVRAHPGRLAITAKSKMHHASTVRVSFSGQRHQTISFEEHDSDVLGANLSATKSLLANAAAEVGPPSKRGHNLHFKDVPAKSISEFFRSYNLHPDQLTLRSDHVSGWIERVAPDSLWNIVIAGRGKLASLGEVELGIGEPVNTINRAPLVNPGPGTANIKALMAPGDAVLDLPDDIVTLAKEYKATYRELRSDHANGRALLVLYPISNHSAPKAVYKSLNRRRPMDAPETLIGLGIVFPDIGFADIDDDGTFYAVTPDWEFAYEEGEEDLLPVDDEGDALIDGGDKFLVGGRDGN